MPIQMKTAQHSADSAIMINIAWPGGNRSLSPDRLGCCAECSCIPAQFTNTRRKHIGPWIACEKFGLCQFVQFDGATALGGMLREHRSTRSNNGTWKPTNGAILNGKSTFLLF